VTVADVPSAVEAELARLRAENARLLKLLRLTSQQAAPPGPAQTAYFEAPPGLVHHRSPEGDKLAFFGALFAARTDVYAVPRKLPYTPSADTAGPVKCGGAVEVTAPGARHRAGGLWWSGS
jgi:hypothetical protein